ncbi:hypothetical protein GCM10023191_008960 [Actinoallomurus oryzae]|uniref:Transposase n=1 Tax=Actinoallomurus oryzae TaxID=502180 RepID=A0ABP8PE63_9ACTN
MIKLVGRPSAETLLDCVGILAGALLRWLPAAVGQREEALPASVTNRSHAKFRGPGERANAQLKTWKTLTKLRCCPPPGRSPRQAIHVLHNREASEKAPYTSWRSWRAVFSARRQQASSSLHFARDWPSGGDHNHL